MLNTILEQTNIYLDSMPKSNRKKYGQFFTSGETAKFMAELFDIPKDKKSLRILDAGAGSGILSCAVVERLQLVNSIKSIYLVCYENDQNIVKLLNENLEYIKNHSTIHIDYEVREKNYILDQKFEIADIPLANNDVSKFDMVIGNPPYMKISKGASEAVMMPEVCYGAPNLYFLFASMSLFNLKDNCEMVYIIPRSWTSGAYFKKFRAYFLDVGKLKHIHVFVSRSKVFDTENVLQETIIVKIKKTNRTPEFVEITSSKSNKHFDDSTNMKIPYDVAVSGENKYVFLITNEYELSILSKLKMCNYTLPEIGIKMKTGLTVDFRNKEILRDTEVSGAIPLFYSQHIKDGLIQFPIQKENQYIVTEQAGLQQMNKNYLFVKRFTAKEEKRRLQCGIYLAQQFPNYEKISTQNKINFIDGISLNLSENVVYGLYVIFNSTIYDDYYRILNGSTQVNSTEINTMPVPDLQCIEAMGEKLIGSGDLSEKNCNKILEEYYV
ncbi:Eco57I restriction-modification methylase domain-containing protein [Listeria seeligeri]|uniref:Eco57I restriction-modification methylase domain-containing protein n=1 Tax=Listeria seeligeri TaxID=1640 RepID=UPI0031CC383C